jgi:hypothetical protein
MRHTHPLSADEQRIDAAMAHEHRSHAERDQALTTYRYALLHAPSRDQQLERVADLMLGEGVR